MDERPPLMLIPVVKNPSEATVEKIPCRCTIILPPGPQNFIVK